MEFEIQAVLSQNITLVYDLLELQAIDRNALRGLVGPQVNPAMMDTPEMIVAVYSPEPIIVQAGDRRIRITLQQPEEDMGGFPIWDIALKCDTLVSRSKSTLVAYGFNYDVSITLSENAHAVTRSLFVDNLQRIESALGGRVLSLTPRLVFERDHTRYDLLIEVVDEEHIKVHLNAHFQFEGIVLPPQDKLQASFREEFGYLTATLSRLFGGSIYQC